MKTRRSTFLVAPVLGLTTLWAAALPGHAVTLEQKWQKGTTYNYDFNMQGDATILTDAPQFPLAGVPIPVKLKGAGQVSLFTSDVNPQGAGSVIPTLAPFNLNADAFGQKLEARFAKDKTQVLFGGNVAWDGAALPATTFQISREGKLLGVVLPDVNFPAPGQRRGPNAGGAAGRGAGGPGRARPNGAPNAPVPAPAPAPAAPAAPTQANPNAKAIGALIQNIITQSFPAVWPGRDVNEGDTWSATVTPPTINAKPGEVPTATAPAPGAKPLGKFDFKLGPEEKIGDRTARRISMSGTLAYTADEAAKPAPAAPGAPGGQLQSINQKVSGNLWFDPTLGQIVRAELDVQSGVRGMAAIQMGPGNGGAPSSGSLDFTGTVQMQLKTVTADAALAAPAIAAPAAPAPVAPAPAMAVPAG